MTGYYQQSSRQLLNGFRKQAGEAYRVLTATRGETIARKVVRAAEQEYAALIPQIPFIGGRANLMSRDLLESVKLLAFYRAMKANGLPYEESFRIVYGVLERQLLRIPGAVRKVIGKLQLSSLFKQRLIRQAQRNRQKTYPGNFVFDVVTGDGEQFDWGIEFRECAILNFFREQGALEFMPYICPNDYLTSKHFGLGLRRTMTLATGACRCDQFMKKGRETTVVVPPGIAL